MPRRKVSRIPGKNRWSHAGGSKGASAMIRSPFRNFIFGIFLGAVFMASFFAWRQTQANAAELPKPCATVAGQTVDQASWDFAQKTLRMQRESIENLRQQLAEAKANQGAQLLAASGHVMNEEQCRAWIGIMPSAEQSATLSTVLYESSRPSVNVSLLPLPGAPRISIGPNSQLAPRWIIAGKIQPQMVGETRKAIYYWYDATSSQWQGPFAPQRVAQ